MSVQTVAHLNFSGQAREALTFYQAVFGGEVMMMTYQQAGKVDSREGADRIMWGQVESKSGFHVMAYDVQAAKPWGAGENAFYVAVRGNSVDEITGFWDKLKDGAEIQHALQPAAWGPAYGMLKDKFGITWIMDVAAS
jgi:PhnB protein